VILFLRFQSYFWTIFTVPAQGFFNALVYFRGTMEHPRRGYTGTAQQTRSLSVFAPAFQQWGSLRRSFLRRHSAASADPIAAGVAHMIQDEDLQDLEEVDPVVERIDRNGANEASRIPSDQVGMDLSTISEVNKH
jgi:hypothetical protein